MNFERQQGSILRQRLAESPRFINIVAGPRQVGKSTLVRQVLSNINSTFVSADQVGQASTESQHLILNQQPEPNAAWLVSVWEQARKTAKTCHDSHYVLAIDEVQKIPRWSELIKGLWDADQAEQLNMHIILLGSSPWLMQKGLTESLAGRYELVPMTHWTYPEMQEAFDFTLDEFIYFGGYPGSAGLITDGERWRNYVKSSLIAPNIDKDILQMTRVDKPALLKAMFELGCNYSGQIISYTKLVGQLQDAGNTVTLAHYLELLSQAGLLTAISKIAGEKHRQRSSSPKLNVLNTAFMSALTGYTFEQAKADRSYWGRLVESAIGAHLVNTAADTCSIHYWRESPHEVDFIIADKRGLTAIEVKSGSGYATPKGLEVFTGKYANSQSLIVGEGGVPLTEFLYHPAHEWLHG